MSSPPEVSIRVVASEDERFGDVVRQIAPEAQTSSIPLGIGPTVAASSINEHWLALEAYNGQRSLGGVLAQLHPDGTAQAIPPRLRAGHSRSTCCSLLNRLNQQLAGRGVTQVTVYVSLQDEQLPSYLTDAGFRRTHDLLVLRASTAGFAGLVDGQAWTMQPCREQTLSTLQTTFARTLAETRDFPDLRIDASVDRVLARLAGSGRTGDRLGYLVVRGSEPAGCLLLTDHADLDQCELMYLGIVPEFRGLGGGRWLAQYAVQRARQLGRSQVIAGVDAENDPAVAAYAAAFFDPVVRRRVYFRRLTAADAVSPCLH